jgi:hypothetical protein
MGMSKYATERLRLIHEKPHIHHVGGAPRPVLRFDLRRHQVAKPVLGTGYGPARYELLSKEVLYRAQRPEMGKISGVYFLWRLGDLIYIGSSKNVHTRTHAVGFDHKSFLLIEFPWYLSVEAAYIAEYYPIENVMHAR